MTFQGLVDEEFQENQSEIYAKNENAIDVVREEGVSAGKVVSEKDRGAYLIALRHPASITGPLGEFSARINEATPAQVFNATNAHTSMFVYRLEETGFEPDEDVLDQLAGCVKSVWGQLRRPHINYGDWFASKDGVVAVGYAGEEFVENINLIGHTAYDSGLEDIMGRSAWGGHITTARFVEDRSPDQLRDFFEVYYGRPELGNSSPERIDVGYMLINGDAETMKNPENGFRYVVDENRRFKF